MTSKEQTVADICPLKVLVYHIGSLGDTIAAVPAFQAIRDNFPHAHITLLTDIQHGKTRVQCHDILDGSGLVDEYLYYKFDSSLFGKVLLVPRMTALLVTLRKKKLDVLVYLIPIEANNPRIKRDNVFFKSAGVKKIIGMTGFNMIRQGVMGHPLPTLPHISDQMLARLAESGLVVPSARESGRYLNISGAEIANVQDQLRQQGHDGDRRWIAVGPGSKMSAKIWPKNRFKELVQGLIEKRDIWPVVFGGKEDEGLAQELIAHWGRGYVAAGRLGIRASMAALKKCALYIGNDTGTLHMAVSMGVTCIGIYSARDYPGLWFPYGEGHVVLRNAGPCEGCMKEVCIENQKACILSVSVDDVYEAVMSRL